MKLAGEERKHLIKNTLKWLGIGLSIGIGIALVLFALAYLLEIFNCLTCGIFDCFSCHSCECGDITCGDVDAVLENDCGCASIIGLFGIWSGKIFLNTVVFCSIVGAIIGLILGIAIAVEEYRELCKFKEIKEKAEQGDADAQYQCGIWYMNKEKVELAKEWLIKSVEQGHAEAIEAMCKHGILLVNSNKAKEAEEWFDKAAKQGHIASKAYLGDAQAQYEYALTLGSIYDKQKWLEKSEAQGCAPAKDELKKVNDEIKRRKEAGEQKRKADAIKQYKEAEEQKRRAIEEEQKKEAIKSAPVISQSSGVLSTEEAIRRYESILYDPYSSVMQKEIAKIAIESLRGY